MGDPQGTLARITVYPVKSLDGLDVTEARVLSSGALEHDRRWQLVDMEGRVVNAKRTPRCHAIRAEFDLAPGANAIHLAVDPAAIAARAIPGIERLTGLAAESFPLVPGPGGPCGVWRSVPTCRTRWLRRGTWGRRTCSAGWRT